MENEEKVDFYYDLEVKSNDGRTFLYTVDPTGTLLNYGSQLSSINFKPIEGVIKRINKKTIEKMILEKEIVENIDDMKWNYEKLVGKYVDNEGFIYDIYDKVKNRIIPSIYTSKYLSQNFNDKSFFEENNELMTEQNNIEVN